MTTPLDSPAAVLRATTRADRLLCAAILLGSLALALGGRAPAAPAGRALVVVGRALRAELPLDRDDVRTFSGSAGTVEVTVRGGAVAVTRSSCPHQVCVSMGWKRRSGEVIACVPNELLVRVEGGAAPRGAPGAEVPDAVTR